MLKTVLDKVLDDRAAKRPVIVATTLASGVQQIIHHEDTAALGPVGEAAEKAFASDHSVTIDTPDGEVFLHVHNPPLRMVVIGAVHTAQQLVPMAIMAGYAVTVIDPRGAFATPERFPGVDLRPEWPDEVWPGLGVDRRTAVIALTHDPKIDDPALTAALNGPAFYIGALGSTRTHAKRVERLGEAGIPEDTLRRLHAPIGLDIGARGPAEIAISILAEVTATLRGRKFGKS
jgi:xanthine dehydrogenase accessory factor